MSELVHVFAVKTLWTDSTCLRLIFDDCVHEKLRTGQADYMVVAKNGVVHVIDEDVPVVYLPKHRTIMGLVADSNGKMSVAIIILDDHVPMTAPRIQYITDDDVVERAMKIVVSKFAGDLNIIRAGLDDEAIIVVRNPENIERYYNVTKSIKTIDERLDDFFPETPVIKSIE